MTGIRLRIPGTHVRRTPKHGRCDAGSSRSTPASARPRSGTRRVPPGSSAPPPYGCWRDRSGLPLGLSARQFALPKVALESPRKILKFIFCRECRHISNAPPRRPGHGEDGNDERRRRIQGSVPPSVGAPQPAARLCFSLSTLKCNAGARQSLPREQDGTVGESRRRTFANAATSAAAVSAYILWSAFRAIVRSEEARNS